MNKISIINKTREENSQEILDKIGEIYNNMHYDIKDSNRLEDFYISIMDYINKEHLYKSDYIN